MALERVPADIRAEGGVARMVNEEHPSQLDSWSSLSISVSILRAIPD